MKILLIYPPFCPPTVPPYSISALKGRMAGLDWVKLKCIDLNAKFHFLRFPEFYASLRTAYTSSPQEYGSVLGEFEKQARWAYVKNNREVINSRRPELFEELLSMIARENPDLVGFSIVYNSQCFYALSLISALKENGIECIAGGPAVNSRIREVCRCLKDEKEFMELIAERAGCKNISCADALPDFSDYPHEDYLTAEWIIPMKSSTTCPYRRCAFCTHFSDEPYMEFDLSLIQRAIILSKAKHVFFIDDMIPKKRVTEIAAALKPLNVKWWCQLRPTADFLGIFEVLYESGLMAVCWGVESGSQRVLDLMSKGTNIEGIPVILKQSCEAGIKNMVYALFGFPTETRQEFCQTMDFLKSNSQNIFLVSTSIFGLQKGSAVYNSPAQFGIAEVKEEKRTVLDEKITFTTKEGLQREDARKLRQKFRRTLKKINKVPDAYKDYKEQVLLLA